MRVLAIFSLLLLLVAELVAGEAEEQRVTVDLHAPRTEIRKTLLKRTPVGSSVENVVQFISKRLEGLEEVSAIRVRPARDSSRPRAVKTIRVYLGQYYKHLGTVFLTAPMIAQEDVSAYWWFDRHDRLIDILVDKRTRVY